MDDAQGDQTRADPQLLCKQKREGSGRLDLGQGEGNERDYPLLRRGRPRLQAISVVFKRPWIGPEPGFRGCVAVAG